MNTPELDKMLAVKDHSQIIGEFLEWQQSNGKWLCELNGQRWEPVASSVETLLADFFDIDLQKAELERRAILAELSNGL